MNEGMADGRTSPVIFFFGSMFQVIAVCAFVGAIAWLVAHFMAPEKISRTEALLIFGPGIVAAPACFRMGRRICKMTLPIKGERGSNQHPPAA